MIAINPADAAKKQITTGDVVRIFSPRGEVRIHTNGRTRCQTDGRKGSPKKALDAPEFLVMQKTFMSETAKFANVLLPGASFLEKSGTFPMASAACCA